MSMSANQQKFSVEPDSMANLAYGLDDTHYGTLDVGAEKDDQLARAITY